MNYNDVPDTINDFLNYAQTIQGKSSQTVKEYYYDLRLFIDYLKSIGVEDIYKISLHELYSFLGYLSQDRKNCVGSRAKKISTLKAFYKYLHKKVGIIQEDPTIELEKPKIPKTLPKYLTLEESNNLLESVEGDYRYRDYAIITLFLNCGLRLSELVNINKSKIKGGLLTVIGKGNKERTIYLNDACLYAIDEHIRKTRIPTVKDSNALFLSKRGTRISKKMVQYIVKKYIGMSGLDKSVYSTHKLRHTAATLMYQHGGVEILILKEILGHSNVNTTQIYTHTNKEQLADAVKSNPLASVRKAL